MGNLHRHSWRTKPASSRARIEIGARPGASNTRLAGRAYVRFWLLDVSTLRAGFAAGSRKNERRKPPYLGYKDLRPRSRWHALTNEVIFFRVRMICGMAERSQIERIAQGGNRQTTRYQIAGSQILSRRSDALQRWHAAADNFLALMVAGCSWPICAS